MMQLAPMFWQRIRAAGPGRFSARLRMRTPLSVGEGVDEAQDCVDDAADVPLKLVAEAEAVGALPVDAAVGAQEDGRAHPAEHIDLLGA